MNTTSKTVEWGPYKVEVSEATLLQGMRRQSMRVIASAYQDQDIDIRTIRTLLWPDLIAAALWAEGFPHWPPTFEEFIALPEQFTNLWETAVYDLNPHWLPSFSPEQDKKKGGSKRTNSSKGS